MDDKIDKYLKKLYAAADYSMFASQLYDQEDHYMVNAPPTVDRIMIEKNLISTNNQLRTLTHHGIKISERGGWKSYQNKEADKTKTEKASQEELQKLIKENYELNNRAMRFGFTQIKYWWAVLIFTIVASAALGAWLQSLFK